VTGRFRLTRAGGGAVVVAILMLAAGLLKTINLLILLGDLLIILVAINVVAAWRITRVMRLTLCESTESNAGALAARTLEVHNTSRHQVIVELRDRSDVHDESITLLISAGVIVRPRLAFTPARRGVHVISTSLASGYPFGFVTHTRAGPAREPLIVGPALGRLDLEGFRRWLARAGAGDARTRRPARDLAAAQSELRGVRPFRSGDNPRQIHWRSSARRGELLVREYDSPEALDFMLVLEAWLPPLETPQARQRLEATVSLAATLLHAWCNGGQSPRAVLAVPGVAEAVQGRASPALARRFSQALARVDGRSQWSEHALPVGSGAPRSMRLLISSRTEAGDLPSFLQSRTGRSWQRLTPEAARPWYHPPRLPGA